MGKFSEALADELILYSQQIAWLNAVPREERKASLASEQPKKEKPLSRLDRMKAKDIDPPMPPLSLPMMVAWLLQIGPTEAAGMGAGPISWASLAQWQETTGVVLSPWQALTLRRMSSSFLAMADEAKAIDCPAPWATKLHEANRAAISRAVSAIFGARASSAPSRA